MQILSVALKKKDSILIDDRNIIDQALGIWISCIVSEPQLLNDLFSSQDASAFTKVLIEDGLLCSSPAVRILFRNAIRTICETVTGSQEKPFVYFLKMLLGHVSFTENKSKESKQFYQLLSQLLQIYLDSKKAG